MTELQKNLEQAENEYKLLKEKNIQSSRALEKIQEKIEITQNLINQEKETGTAEEMALKKEIVELAETLEANKQKHYEKLTNMALTMNEKHAIALKELQELKEKYDTITKNQTPDKKESPQTSKVKKSGARRKTLGILNKKKNK